ncbi:lysophospholipase L1-like esterase [Flavobacterium nitrogenifigens]|uniref:Lysophospholipase L1-like esterase n=2 Tax=Flavobacterium TaxID=237 RepID=A0A7W7IXD8_9FLAO|nr:MULTISPECIES: SGNH/GDSL hydrolase family protein [Flavobacterium]MBB4802364.1 lysophospholipase L1-like esterase [Flavobacterium nitrogenifigens]MBB6387322.1 lysophospholipase L1-like esterase [Flavobacterium notoginsengisoli]
MKTKTLLYYSLLFFFTFQLTYSQDWPNLNRYKEQNSKVPVLSSKDHSRVVFMGNSITEGWLNKRPDFFNSKNYINRGISGQTTPQMLLRFRQDVIALKPAVVVILAGINDIAENTGPYSVEATSGNIFSMCELAKQNGIKVIVCSVLPALEFQWRKGMEPAPKVVELNKIIKSYAEKNKLFYVDYYSAMVNDKMGLKDELCTDGVHPNEAGYAVMEPILEKTIAKALKK